MAKEVRNSRSKIEDPGILQRARMEDLGFIQRHLHMLTAKSSQDQDYGQGSRVQGSKPWGSSLRFRSWGEGVGGVKGVRLRGLGLGFRAEGFGIWD